MTRSVAIRKLLARRPNKSDMLGIFLLLFPFIALLTPLTQVTTDYQSPFYQLLFYYKMVSLVVILFLYVNQGSLRSFDKSVLVFLGVWAIAVFINSNDISSIVNEMGAIIFYCCMFGYYVRKSPAGFLFVYFICLGFMLFLNLFYLIVYPDGLFQTDSIWNSSRINFLGLDNQISPLLFIWFILFYLTKRIGYYRKAINVFGLLVICGNIILLNVGTLYTAALLFVLSMFLYRRVPKLFQMKTALLIIFIVFLSVVLLRLQYLFEFFIVDILNKDITLTGRLVIWDEAIILFSNQPFFGYGLSSIGWLVQGNRHAHNTILQILLQCGLIGFLAFFTVIWRALRIFFIKKYRLKPYYVFFTIMFIAYNFACLTEVYLLTYYIIILLFLFYARFFDLAVDKRYKAVIKK